MKYKIKSKFTFLIALVFASALFTGCNAQEAFGEQYLKLEKTIPLPGVKGRIDHMDIDIKHQIVYIAALGNNTLEAVDLQRGKVIHHIHGLDEPQGVAYIPQKHEIIVANGGNGDCYFYNTQNFEKTGVVHLSSDADDVRYDSANEEIYVGYGEGGIAMIDVVGHRVTGDVKLPAHPEGFQVENKTKQIFVNLPDARELIVINADSQKIVAHWRMSMAAANFPMALNEMHNRLFSICRRPSRLVVLDQRNGKVLLVENCVGDADDVYYDENRKRIYISGGEGYINIFGENDSQSFEEIANIATRKGARTSLFVPQLQLLILAEPGVGDEDARLLVYKAVK